VYFDTNTLLSTNIVATGGRSGDGSIAARNGGAGTIYLKNNANANGDVIISNGGLVTTNATAVTGGSYGQFTVTGNAVLAMTGDVTPGTDLVITNSSLTLNGGITVPGNLALDGSNVTVAGAVNVTGTLTLQNGSVLSHYGATTTDIYNLKVTAASVTIDTTSKIDVTGKGYQGGLQGSNGRTYGNTTTGGSQSSAGGSYGGLGGWAYGEYPPNASYGSMQLPDELGSGGNSNGNPGGNGGGLVQLTTGALSLSGSILADGGTVTNPNGGSAGSGGGILLKVGALSGTGTISARGGSNPGSNYYGSGGGGRIAVYYNTNTLSISNITAAGGVSGDGSVSVRNGGVGTVYLLQNVMPLNLAINGTGTGTVSSSPAGLSCGADCSAQFVMDSSVTLTATANAGSIFSGWSGACSGMGICSIIMGTPRNVTATFTSVLPPTVTIVAPSGLTSNNKPTLIYNVSAGTVVVKVDGVTVNKVSGSALDSLADGSHQIQVTSTNGAGAVGSATATVVVDTAPPALSAGALATPVRVAALTLTGTVETGATVSISSTSGASIGPVSFGSGNWACPVSNLATGLNTFTITATDLAGNVSTTVISTTYLPQVAISLSTPFIVADYQGTIGITVTNITPPGSSLLIEQFIDANHDGTINPGDYAIRSFTVTDGTVSSIPNSQGDEDGSANGSLMTTLDYFLTNDLFHAPGHYLFRVTSGAFSASIPFAVNPVSQVQTVSGFVSDGTNMIPGALIRMEDKWQRPVAWATADGSGNYVLDIGQPGDYSLTPIVYGYQAPTTPVTVAASQNLSNQNLTVTPGTHQITGGVIDAASSAGIGGVWVQAKGTNTASFAITGQDGSYVLMLAAGQYAVNTLGNATVPGTSAKGYTNFDSHPLNLSVTGNGAGNTITLANGNVPVSGKVLDQAGNPVAGLPVIGRIPGTLDVRAPASYAASNAAGNYSLGLFAGAGWQVALDNNAALSLGYLGTTSGNLSTSAGPLTGQNLTVAPVTAWIKGTVTDSTGKLLPGIEVQLRNADSSVVASVFSAQDGSYRLGAYAGTWYLDAFMSAQGLPAVPEQTVPLAAAETSTNDFIADVTPPCVTITAPHVGIVTDPKLVLAYTVSQGTVVVLVDGVAVNKQSGAALDFLSNGQHTVRIQATDTLGTMGYAEVTFSVNYTPPSILTTSLPFGTTGVAYSQVLMASGGLNPYVWSLASGILPANLTLNPSTGAISGTPSTVGTSSFTVQVNDIDNVTATASLSMVTYAPLAISTTSLPNGYVGSVYNQILAVTGGKSPFIWSISSGTLPAGLSLNSSTGAITGTPTTAGSGSTINFQAKDANNRVVSVSLTINVNAALAISTSSLSSGIVGTAYSQTLSATGGKLPVTWSVTVGTLPAGLSLNASTGVISGTPTSNATGSITFRVIDANAVVATKALTLTISSQVKSLDPWSNIYSAAPNNTSASNLAAGSFAVGTGSNRLLLVSAVMKIGTAANPTISATYGGTALTQIKITANTQKEVVWVGYLTEAQIGSGSKALAITYSGATGNASGLHIKWGSFSGVNQTTPVASSGGADTNTTSATFGSAISYVINGMTTVVSGNGGTPATGTLSATPAFVTGTATTTNAQTSKTFTTATNTTAGSYASTTPVTWSGTTSNMSGVVAVSLQP
jgi:hypothetical protein